MALLDDSVAPPLQKPAADARRARRPLMLSPVEL
jgi:hypothetical protein